MCRYSDPNYRSHFVCFKCRIAWKRHKGYTAGSKPTCHKCHGEAFHVGRDFHAPKKNNKRQWRKIELIVSNGMVWDSCGCSGPGYTPHSLWEAKQWIQKKKAAKAELIKKYGVKYL